MWKTLWNPINKSHQIVPASLRSPPVAACARAPSSRLHLRRWRHWRNARFGVRRCPVKLKNNAWFDTPKKGEKHVKQVFLPGYDSTSIFHNLSIYIVYVSEFFWYVQPKLSCVHEEWWWYCDMRPCFFSICFWIVKYQAGHLPLAPRAWKSLHGLRSTQHTRMYIL